MKWLKTPRISCTRCLKEYKDSRMLTIFESGNRICNDCLIAHVNNILKEAYRPIMEKLLGPKQFDTPKKS